MTFHCYKCHKAFARILDRNDHEEACNKRDYWHAARMMGVGMYAIASLITFGHAWSFLGWAHDVGLVNHDPWARFVCSMLCSVGWPLYWSGWAWTH